MSQYFQKSRPKPKSNFNSQSGRPPRQVRVPKFMDVDYNLLVKKANPQTIEDYKPIKTISEHNLHPNIVKNLKIKGYNQFTEIQDKAIPVIMERKDIIGIANTGTGKTAAFLLPLVDQVLHNPKKVILVLAPTRELVNQIASELSSFIKGSPITYTTIIGGQSAFRQINDLKTHRNFIISTTGRGLDLINQKALKIHTIDTIVLDEMDQMLDMGFIRDIHKILALATRVEHKLFFSATMTKEIEKVARELLNKQAVIISVVRGKTADNVDQDVLHLEAGESKIQKLVELLTGKIGGATSGKTIEKAIIFENTKHGAARIEKDLNSHGLKSLAIHGNKNQNQRNKALEAFKSGEINYLVATNVAARGLDIPLVSHVINYSLPESKEDYVHRIGRTGRAGEVGNAITFITHDQIPKKK
jgi:ATP-dependent RNA helicase RhlE